MFYSYLCERFFPAPNGQNLIRRLTILKFVFLTISSVQNTIIIGNVVCILSDLDNTVQKVGFEKIDPTLMKEGLGLWVQATS